MAPPAGIQQQNGLLIVDFDSWTKSEALKQRVSIGLRPFQDLVSLLEALRRKHEGRGWYSIVFLIEYFGGWAERNRSDLMRQSVVWANIKVSKNDDRWIQRVVGGEQTQSLKLSIYR